MEASQNRLMSNGGKRLKELIRQRGFRLGAVTEAIDVAPSTMDRWTDNAPIGKLVKLSKFTGIPLMDVINGYSQAKLGKQIGVSQSAVKLWESGQCEPSISNVIALAKALKVSIKTICSSMGIDVAEVPND